MFLMDCITFFKNLNLKAEFGWGFLLFVSLNLLLRHYIRFFCDLRGKSGGLKKGLSSKSDFDVEFCKNIASCESKLLKVSKTCDGYESSNETMRKTKNSSDDVDCKVERFLDSEFGESIDCVDEKKVEHELYDEDEEFDVLKLRKMVKCERNKARKACLELEKEQLAASSAAEETMAMILRLQNEKSLVEMEANQYKRLAEEKQLHAQEVIQSLQLILLMHESHKAMESDDGEESWISSNGKFENASNHGLFRSVDVDLSPW